MLLRDLLCSSSASSYCRARSSCCFLFLPSHPTRSDGPIPCSNGGLPLERSVPVLLAPSLERSRPAPDELNKSSCSRRRRTVCRPYRCWTCPSGTGTTATLFSRCERHPTPPSVAVLALRPCLSQRCRGSVEIARGGNGREGGGRGPRLSEVFRLMFRFR